MVNLNNDYPMVSHLEGEGVHILRANCNTLTVLINSPFFLLSLRIYILLRLSEEVFHYIDFWHIVYYWLTLLISIILIIYTKKNTEREKKIPENDQWPKNEIYINKKPWLVLYKFESLWVSVPGTTGHLEPYVKYDIRHIRYMTRINK